MIVSTQFKYRNVLVINKHKEDDYISSTTNEDTRVIFQLPYNGQTINQKHNQTPLSFSYYGLDRFSDDTDQEWNERSYSMSDFYHQYIRFEDKYKDEDIEKGIVHTYVLNLNDVDH